MKKSLNIKSKWKVGDIIYSLPTGLYSDKIKAVKQFDKVRYEFSDGSIMWDTQYYWDRWTTDKSKLRKHKARK